MFVAHRIAISTEKEMKWKSCVRNRRPGKSSRKDKTNKATAAKNIFPTLKYPTPTTRTGERKQNEQSENKCKGAKGNQKQEKKAVNEKQMRAPPHRYRKELMPRETPRVRI